MAEPHEPGYYKHAWQRYTPWGDTQVCSGVVHTVLLFHSEGVARCTPSTAQGVQQQVPVQAASDFSIAASREALQLVQARAPEL